MYGGMDGADESLYGAALMASVPAKRDFKPHVNSSVDTVLVDSGALGHYFVDTLIPELKHRLQDCTSLSTTRSILIAGGALLDGTAGGVRQGLIIDEYGEQHLARITITFVPGIGCNRFSGKLAARKGTVSNRFEFRCQQPQFGSGRHPRATLQIGRRCLLPQPRPHRR